MQEFCPQCAKNGQENKIKAFQLNFDEAIFMCSNKACTWPVGYQNLTVINRSIGKEHSSNWEKLACTYLKTEQDRLLEFQPYTPPQTPATLPDVMSISAEDILFLSDNQQISSNFNKPCNSIVDSTISNKMNSKPKVVSVQMVSNITTSVTDKPVLIKTGKITLGPPIVKRVKIEPNETSRAFKRAKRIRHPPYKKFSLNDLSKAKGTNVNNKSALNLVKVEEVEIKTQDCIDELSTIANNVNSSNLDVVIVDPIKDNGIDLDSILKNNPKDQETGFIDDDVLDITLDDIWDFSNEMDGTLKPQLETADECKWLNDYLKNEFE